MDARPVRPALRRGARLLIVFVALPMLMGASARSRNFVVEAPTEEAAQSIARHAETFRQSIAVEWLGQELPDWSQPCPIKVKITEGEAGGVTSFGFAGGRVTDQRMSVEGRLDRIIASALPHEVTHTIFAAYFGGPMPRWADEGASLLSEDDRERDRHDQIAARLLARQGAWPLGRLFSIEEYPQDLMGFYGQGYSVSRFLVEIGGRPRFLHFVKDGMQRGWDVSARDHYGLANCRELDLAWRSWHNVATSTPSNADAEVVRAQSPEEARVVRR
ncbi:hypothetical protein BH23PLA1_BH23PLA1_36050 [soil metagenome]